MQGFLPTLDGRAAINRRARGDSHPARGVLRVGMFAVR
jgi:hypothetical protein